MWPEITVGWFTKTVLLCHVKPGLVASSHFLWPTVLGLRWSPSWNVCPSRCWEDLSDERSFPLDPSSLSCHSLSIRPLKLFLLIPPFCLNIFYLFISFLSIYHSSVFLPIPLLLHRSFLSFPSCLKWFYSVLSGISELRSITVECAASQMLQGHSTEALHPSSTAPPIPHPSALLWSGRIRAGAACAGAKRRCWLGSRPIPVVLFHVCHVSPCTTKKKKKHLWFLGHGSLRLTLWQHAGSLQRALALCFKAQGEAGRSEVSRFSSCS